MIQGKNKEETIRLTAEFLGVSLLKQSLYIYSKLERATAT